MPNEKVLESNYDKVYSMNQYGTENTIGHQRALRLTINDSIFTLLRLGYGFKEICMNCSINKSTLLQIFMELGLQQPSEYEYENMTTASSIEERKQQLIDMIKTDNASEEDVISEAVINSKYTKLKELDKTYIHGIGSSEGSNEQNSDHTPVDNSTMMPSIEDEKRNKNLNIAIRNFSTNMQVHINDFSNYLNSPEIQRQLENNETKYRFKKMRDDLIEGINQLNDFLPNSR
ncbi:uncharacterized protein RNJ42_02384 [Nakaseomyces bracarensis]|uniref:uncharacterized protein n=1 Tax=Nakaseomyces bracarensis TaxID=273131 RepID=UPI0038725AF4